MLLHRSDILIPFFCCSSKAMRSHEGNEAQVCYFIIQLLLLKPNDFRNRVSDFVKENSPEHWLQNDWHTKHMSYHKVLIQFSASVNLVYAVLRILANWFGSFLFGSLFSL